MIPSSLSGSTLFLLLLFFTPPPFLPFAILSLSLSLSLAHVLPLTPLLFLIQYFLLPRQHSTSVRLHLVAFLVGIGNSEKILSTPSFGGEVKPSVPCRRFAACIRSLDLRGSRNLGKITTGHLSRPQFHLSLIGISRVAVDAEARGGESGNV